MTTPLAKNQTAELRRMLGYVAARRVLVIDTEGQVDGLVDSLRITPSGMGRDTAVVSVWTVLTMAGMLEQYDETVDVTLVAARFGTWAFGTVAEVCDDTLLTFSDGPEGIKSACTLFKKTAVLRDSVDVHIVVCGAHSVDSTVRMLGDLANTVGRYPNTRIDFASYLPENRHVELALSLGRSVANALPASPPAMVFRQLTGEMPSWVNIETRAGGGSAPSRMVMSMRAPVQPTDESAQATSTSALTAIPGVTTHVTELVY